jgi:hypothetical protein
MNEGGAKMENKDTYEAGGKGTAVGSGGKQGSAASQTGAPTPMDQNIEEERQRRQENWAPAAQTGFDNADVERHEEIYPEEPPSDVEEAKRESINE